MQEKHGVLWPSSAASINICCFTLGLQGSYLTLPTRQQCYVLGYCHLDGLPALACLILLNLPAVLYIVCRGQNILACFLNLPYLPMGGWLLANLYCAKNLCHRTKTWYRHDHIPVPCADNNTDRYKWMTNAHIIKRYPQPPRKQMSGVNATCLQITLANYVKED